MLMNASGGSMMGSMDVLAPPQRIFKGRVLMTAEQTVPQLQGIITTIQARLRAWGTAWHGMHGMAGTACHWGA